MTFPLPPLYTAERVELITAPDQRYDTLHEIQVTCAKVRNREFPGWIEVYERAITQWLAWQKNQEKPRA